MTRTERRGYMKRKKTHTNPLSKREVEVLRKNPYVASVTEKTVRFTEAFKKLAYDEKHKGVAIYHSFSKGSSSRSRL